MRLIILSLTAVALLGCAVEPNRVVQKAPETQPIAETPVMAAQRTVEAAADQVVAALRKRIDAGEITTPAFATLAVDWGERAVRLRSPGDPEYLPAIRAYVDLARSCVGADEDPDDAPTSLNHAIASYSLLNANLLMPVDSKSTPALATNGPVQRPIDAKGARAIAAIHVCTLLQAKADEGPTLTPELMELVLRWDRRAHLATPTVTHPDGLIAAGGMGLELTAPTYAQEADEMVTLSANEFANDKGAGVTPIETAKYFKADAVHPTDAWQPAHDHLERDAARQMSESAGMIVGTLARRARFGEPLTVEFVNRYGVWSRAACLATIASNDDSSEREAALARHRHALQVLESQLKIASTERPELVELQRAMVHYLLCEVDLWNVRFAAGAEWDVVE